MPNVLDIPIKKLFIITVILKIGSAFMGWYAQSPWILGFWFPLSVMAAYIAIGLKRRDGDVTDEKFADSCYYLGFIFTIASIIFSLFDLPNIGTKIQDIAVRFGAAMVTTCAGLVVRVYLVSFEKNVDDVTKDVEDSIIQASRMFREQLVIAYEKTCDFQSQVDNAAKATVERVNMHVEKLSQDHAEKLNGFFVELTNRNQDAFNNALNEVKLASSRLSDSVDGYSHGMKANLSSIENKVTAFGNAVTERFKNTTFPDDYFIKQLAPLLDQIKNAANDISLNIMQTSEEVAKSTLALSSAFKKFNTKAKVTENSLETVIRLATQQQAMQDVAQSQFTTLDKLGETLAGFESLINSSLDGLKSISAINSELTGRVGAVVIDGLEARKQLESSLMEVVAKLGENVAASNILAMHIDETAVASREVATSLGVSANAAELVAAHLSNNTTVNKEVAEKLDSVVAVDFETAKTMTMMGEKATLAITKIDTAIEQLQEIVHQLVTINHTAQSQNTLSQSPVIGNNIAASSNMSPGSRWRLPFGPFKPPTPGT